MPQGEIKIAYTDRKLLVFCQVHLIYYCHLIGLAHKSMLMLQG